MQTLDRVDILLSAVFIALGGLTKGFVGLGMPLVAVPLLSYLMPVPQALAVMVMPMLLTNLYQMVAGGNMVPAFRRLWPLLIALAAGIPAGAYLLASLKGSILSLVLGTLVILIGLSGFFQQRVLIASKREKWAGPVVGLAAGILGGIAGLFGPLLAIYFLALRLPKDSFIGAVGTSFVFATIPLVVSLVSFGILGPQEFLYSSLGLIPAFAGLIVGQRVRAWISQELFRKALLVTLVVTGLNLVQRGLLG